MVFGICPMDKEAGRAALGAVKIGTVTAYKMASLYQENAQHATAAAMEMDNTRRLIERYVLGTDEDTHHEPLAAPLEENPQRYYDFPYKLGADTWSTNYPVPAGKQFRIESIDEHGQDRFLTRDGGPSILEQGPLGWGKPEKKGLLRNIGDLTGMTESGFGGDPLLLALGPPPQRQHLEQAPLRHSSSFPPRHCARQTPSSRAHAFMSSAQSRPAVTPNVASKAGSSGTSRRSRGILSIGNEFL